jgi:hypothetical protein
METSLLKELLERAFQEGFSASAEGFNGECAFDHLAPDNQSLEKTEAECVARLADEAVKVQWIPVAERMPERGGAVLGFLARGTTEGDHDYHMAWRHMDDRQGLRWNGPGEPTHWMPLPAPPSDGR